jgi:uncharacterized protein (TIGR02757 family)
LTAISKPLSPKILKPGLDRLYNLFDRSFISPDPLECVPLNGNQKDTELSAFIASVFAYGRADLIVKNVSYILGELGKRPYAALKNGTYSSKLKSFKYRFHKRADLLWLLDRLREIYEEYGSLEKAFIATGENHFDRLHGFSLHFHKKLGKRSQARTFLVPSPKSGAACKRMNLFLRWMVRSDSLDLGLWKKVKPSELIIPLDVHVHRIAGRIGLVSNGAANFKKAVELTENLKLLDPADPVRYDFAICSLGKLGHCGKEPIQAKCRGCLIKTHCVDNKA